MKIALSNCLQPARTPIHLDDDSEYLQVTVSLNGRGVSLRHRIHGSDVKTKSQFRVRAGQFIYSRIDARNGAMGIVPPDLDGAVVTGDFPVFEINTKILNPAYFAYMARSHPFIETCKQASRGVTNRKRLKESELLSIVANLPDVSEQERLSARLARIERAVDSASSFCAQLVDDHDEFLFGLIFEVAKKAPRLPMDTIAPIIRRKVEADKDTEYRELGIRSFGKGTFHKPAIKGGELGSKRLYRIEPGDLLFNNVFAWEGAIAVAQPEDKNRFGSHRFITCLPNPSKAVAEYLRTWFLTPEGMAEIRAASPGAAGRNRTLNLKKLEAIQVPIPDMLKQRRFTEVYARIQAARRLNTQTAAELDTLLPSILDKTFKGGL